MVTSPASLLIKFWNLASKRTALGFIDFLRTKHFWISLLIAGLMVFAIIKFTMYSLSGYTHHGESILVPDLIEANVDTIQGVLKAQLLDYHVIDSTFLQSKSAGIILDQDPDPGESVKEGRKIYLTVTRKIPPPVSMPDLVDLKLEIARDKLQKAGLSIGGIQYYPGLGKNLVLKQLYNDKEITMGTKLPKGSKVELILADGIGETKVNVPNLLGRTLKEAKWTLTLLKLNLGHVGWDKSIEDSSAAVIYRQVPEFDPLSPEKINFGEAIDIYLTQTLPDFLRQFSADTTGK